MLASIVGTLMFTSEVQHGTLPNAVMAQPARWVIVAAKAVVASGFGLVMGIVGMTAGFAGAVLPAKHPKTSEWGPPERAPLGLSGALSIRPWRPPRCARW